MTPRKMQQRYFSVAEVDRLLEAYVACGLGEKVGTRRARRGRHQARELSGARQQALLIQQLFGQYLV